MTNNEIQIKLKQRLNKVSSVDYDNLMCTDISEAFNKAQRNWIRRQLSGNNLSKTGVEQTTRRIDDLQILLKSEKLSWIARDKFYESCDIPEDFMEFARLTVTASTECCKDQDITLRLNAETDISEILVDDLKKPNFNWRESVTTFFGNKMRVYTNNEFTICEGYIHYWRQPTDIQILDCYNIATGNQITTDVPCEFKNDIVELFIDEAASIIAGDISIVEQYQRLTQEVEKNN